MSAANPISPAGTGLRLPRAVVQILRFDGLAIAALSVLLYARTGASWWLFAALWLLPDLSMLGYLAGPYRGARIYNSIHAYATPVTMAFFALLLHADTLLPMALIWINHIAVDRLLGYGLKYPTGFGHTHLGSVGHEAGGRPMKPEQRASMTV